jgi:hypothetical protein
MNCEEHTMLPLSAIFIGIGTTVEALTAFAFKVTVAGEVDDE